MPAFLKVVVFFVILIVMLAILGSVPKTEKEFLMLGTFVICAWMLGGAFYGVRGIFRFITR
jgi:hypothetical protein